MKNKITLPPSYVPKTLAMTNHAAAVMVVLLECGHNKSEIVLTKRSVNLPTYSGHYSFPGGMKDPSDPDLLATATRELQEELSISASNYQLLGALDDFTTHDNQLVRPFVIRMDKVKFTKMVHIQQSEIESIYYFPLEKLNQFKDNPLLHSITMRRPSYSFIDDHVFVWGLTAAILVHFAQVLNKNMD